ncbi:hypothetical protein [Streptomyces sp. NPDC003710]
MDTWQELSALVEKRLKAVSSGERGVFACGKAFLGTQRPSRKKETNTFPTRTRHWLLNCSGS